jgi:hypothetical protein
MRFSQLVIATAKWLSQAIKRQSVPVMEHLFAVWLVHQKVSIVLTVLILLAAVQFRRN